MERSRLTRWLSWALITAVWGGLAIYSFRRHSPAYLEDRAQFDILYDDSRRVLQHFTKCLPTSDEQRAAVVRHFSAMRRAAVVAQFGDDAELMDMQEMIRSRPPGEPNQSDALTCQRLSYLGRITRAQVDQTIASAESFLAQRH